MFSLLHTENIFSIPTFEMKDLMQKHIADAGQQRQPTNILWFMNISQTANLIPNTLKVLQFQTPVKNCNCPQVKQWE